jgi:ubiquinone/menaquinone biosynthesis C-methylase UbiE
MKAAWGRLIAFGFRLLYNELAWLYDAVSWVVSRGLWRRWQQTALAYVPPGARVLEVGFGPGHLLVDLAGAGHRPVGLDISPAMLRLARRRLRGQQPGVALCRGKAQDLPFAGEAFDAVILTFPTPFVYDPLWLANLWRVLRAPQEDRPGGRLVLVHVATFAGNGPLDRFLEWLFQITGQRGHPTNQAGHSHSLRPLLAARGFHAWRETVPVEGTEVHLILAEKVATGD